MKQNVQNWIRTTKVIYASVLLAALSGVVVGVLYLLLYVFSADNLMITGSVGTNLFVVLMWISQLGFIAGILLYFLYMGNMRRFFASKGVVAIGQIRVGLFFVLLSSIVMVFHIPELGMSLWLAGLINILAYVVMMVGFNTLNKSNDIPYRVRVGFGRVFVANILLASGTLLLVLFSWIPYAGLVFLVIASASNMVGFCFIISGWCRVKSVAIEG